MKESGTTISVSKAVGHLGDIDKGKEVQSVPFELGMESDVQVGRALIDMYSKCGSPHEARAVFDSNFINFGVNMPWNAMISGYSQNGCSQESFGTLFHGMVLKSGHDMMVISVCNTIADAYAKCGALEYVKKIFYRMEDRDMVSWTTPVTAHSQCLVWEEALAIFSQMTEEGFRPNQFTFSSVQVSCSGLCFLEYGQQIHGLLCKAGLDTDKCIESALVDMYANCGSVREAEKVFERISNPDTVSWTAMISSYAQHGLSEDAFRLFRKMEQLGMKPNSVTLLCVLFACSHRELQTLLGACRVHGNVEKVLSVRADSATYFLLSNTYIESGSFEDGLTLRGSNQQHPQKDDIYAKLEELREKRAAVRIYMIQAYKVQTANAMKQDICRDINPSNIQLVGDVMQTSLLPHTPSNSRPENAMDAGGFTDLETSLVLPVCNTCHMKNKKESKSNVYHQLLLISSLLASTTLHTALKIQGYRVEESYEYNSSINDAVSQTENQYYFYSNWLIIMFNSIAFFLSVALLMRLFNELPLRPLLQVSVFSMVGAYLCTILDPFKPRAHPRPLLILLAVGITPSEAPFCCRNKSVPMPTGM
ncbi:hypothetical protein Patl1_20738 [Pistacia atlantica]|uniref:Uncharacterized protein n=1 Tax=Pistacia atlantica TaxID=434234 RepID=A0ACC1BJR3_9ROSI|nr:hypothetical protein Patl1_20738 [Pistacia atlantica]